MENSYEQLIDDYNNGILVEAGESLTDYISRMGGVNYKANGGIITALRIGLANGSEEEKDKTIEEILKEIDEEKTSFNPLKALKKYLIEQAGGGESRIKQANGSLSPDELAALEEEVKQNPKMVNEITDIEFGVNKPGPATDQGPYPMDNEKRDTIVDMLNMGTDIAVIKEITKATDKEMDEAIDFFKYGAAGFPIPSFDSSGKMTDDGLYKGRESRPESKANGGVAGILKV